MNIGIIKKTTVNSNSAKYEVDIGLKKSAIINIDTKCGDNLSEGEIVIVKINSNGSKIFKLKGRKKCQ